MSCLGMASFCHVWSPNLGMTAKPLSDKLRGPEADSPAWDTSCGQAFNKLNALLRKAPAFTRPDLAPFGLHVHDRQSTTVGILTPMLGPVRRTVAYFSKQPDMMAKGLPPCLRAAATCILIKAEKLSQPMALWTPHQFSTLLESK